MKAIFRWEGTVQWSLGQEAWSPSDNLAAFQPQLQAPLSFGQELKIELH